MSLEVELREQKEPWPKKEKELTKFIADLLKKNHDYGSCCYAMSLAAVAAFNYVSGVLGITGGQASCADLDFLRRTRGIKGSFIFLKAEDLLYPQYDLRSTLEKWIVDQRPWLKKEAEKLIAERGNSHSAVHSEVLAHWKRLAQ